MVLEELVVMGWPGLAREVTEIWEEIGLENVCENKVDKEEVKEAIRHHPLKELKD
jgi:hypothetical protein